MPGRAVQAAPPFQHVILVIQENRTPDNIFGSNPSFEPGVDIATSGVTSHGRTVPLQPLPWTSCYDLDHSHKSFMLDLHIGFNAGPTTPPTNTCTIPKLVQYAYVDNSQGGVQPYFDIATQYGFANRMFQTNQGPSFPAHQFLYGATSAPATVSDLFLAENPQGAVPKGTTRGGGCLTVPGLTAALISPNGSETLTAPIYPCVDHPVLSDVLEAANLSWRYYAAAGGSIWNAPNTITHVCGPVPQTNGTNLCEGADYIAHDVPRKPAQVLTDIAACNLPSVAWVTPTGEASDHANETNGTGPAWVASIVNALGSQAACPNGETYWNDTAILITWDDWGGWYDHVPPFQLNIRNAKQPAKWGDGYTYGFRVPLMVVSAYTPAGFVDNTIHDFGSLVYFIEQNFGLGFVGPGGSLYGNYADYQAAQRGDNMSEFFPLTTPRAFTPIPSPLPPSYFINLPLSNTPVDDD